MVDVTVRRFLRPPRRQDPRTLPDTIIEIELADLQLLLLVPVALWLLTRRGPSGIRLWAILAVAFGVLSTLPAFGIDVSTTRQLGLVLFHLLATVVVIVVVRQQLGRLATP